MQRGIRYKTLETTFIYLDTLFELLRHHEAEACRPLLELGELTDTTRCLYCFGSTERYLSYNSRRYMRQHTGTVIACNEPHILCFCCFSFPCSRACSHSNIVPRSFFPYLPFSPTISPAHSPHFKSCHDVPNSAQTHIDFDWRLSSI